MNKNRPFVLTIAGFDPCGGAGVLADIKTFEANKTLGMAVITSITYQNEHDFKQVEWLSFDQIKKQIDILFTAYNFEYVKIGLIKDFKELNKIISHLFSLNKSIRIIWDPIFSTSSGFTIQNEVKKEEIEKICSSLYLITPNQIEMQRIYPDLSVLDGAKSLSQYCNVFLKGGHSVDFKGRDYLFVKTNLSGGGQNFKAKIIVEYPKHGSGCIMSSAITANLAKGFKLGKACLMAKEYITNYLSSNKSLLGFHKI